MQRRMLSDAIIESGDFYELSIQEQVLYLHLIMSADNRGYVNNIKKIVASTDGLDLSDINGLVAKKFVLKRSENLYLIKGWYIHNEIPTYVSNETTYTEDLQKLFFDNNFAYTEKDTGNRVAFYLKKPLKENKNKNKKENQNKNENENKIKTNDKVNVSSEDDNVMF